MVTKKTFFVEQASCLFWIMMQSLPLLEFWIG